MSVFNCKITGKIMNSKTCGFCFSTKPKLFNSRLSCKYTNSIPLEELPLHAIRLEDATRDLYYRTALNLLIKIEKKLDNKKVRVYSESTGNSLDVPSNTIVYSDISALLQDKGYEEKKDGDGDITSMIKKRGEQNRKETKTSYIDSLLLKGIDVDEIVKLTIEKYNDEGKKVKRLIWSRRATIKKKADKEKV